VKDLFELFTSFMLVGVMTFGGGYAMLPMFIKEIVDKRGWATYDEMLDYYAISQCTPGAIAVNTATFIGYKRKGALGAAAATVGVVLPSLVVIVVIAMFLSNFMEIVWIQHAFAGIRIAVCALIASTVVNLYKRNAGGWLKAIIVAAAFAGVAFLSVSPIYLTMGFAVFGALYYGRRQSA
jgi:chromate transporter